MFKYIKKFLNIEDKEEVDNDTTVNVIFYDENKNINNKYIGLEPEKQVIDFIKNYNIEDEIVGWNKFPLSMSIRNRFRTNNTAKFVAYEDNSPNLNRMNNDQLNYYFRWRSAFLNGNYSLNVSRGYIRVFVMELANYGFSQNLPFILSTLELIKDTYPLMRPGSLAVRNDLLIEIGAKDYISVKFDNSKLYNKIKNNDFNITYSIIDDLYLDGKITNKNYKKASISFKNNVGKKVQSLITFYKEEGYDVLNYCFKCNEKIEYHDLFSSIPLQRPRGKGKVLTKKFEENERFLLEINAIIDFMLYKINICSEWTSSYLLPKEFVEKYLDDAKECLRKSTNANLKSNGILQGEFYSKDKILNDKYDKYKTPSYIYDELNKLKEQKNEKYSTYHYYKDKYVLEADYVACHYKFHIGFSDLNQEQLRYYLYWRMKFLNGEYVETNSAYVELFITELINFTFSDDLQQVLSILDIILKKYNEEFLLFEPIDELLCELGFVNYKNEYLAEKDILYKEIVEYERYNQNYNIWLDNDFCKKNKELSNLVINNQTVRRNFKNNILNLINYYKINGYDISKLWFADDIKYNEYTSFQSYDLIFDRRAVYTVDKRIIRSDRLNSDIKDCILLALVVVNKVSFFEYNYSLPIDFIIDFLKSFKSTNYSKILRELNEYDKGEDKKTKDVSKFSNSIDYNSISYDSIDLVDDLVENIDDKIIYSDEVEFANTDVDALDIEDDVESVDIDSSHREFINLFDNGKLEKKRAINYCLKNKLMLNAYVSSINDFYYDVLGKELIVIDDDYLVLNVEVGVN